MLNADDQFSIVIKESSSGERTGKRSSSSGRGGGFETTTASGEIRGETSESEGRFPLATMRSTRRVAD